MNHTLITLLQIVAVLVALGALAWLAVRPTMNRLVALNIAEGTHEESVTKLTDAAISTRHLLYARGSDDNHIAVCGVDDIPLGTVPDEASAAEEYVAVALLGKGASKLMVASEAIGANARVYVAASGKVATEGSICVGVAVTAASTDGDLIEVIDTVPAQAPITAGSVAVAADELAIPVTHRIVLKTTGADAEALTLADGAPGQLLTVVLAVDGGGTGTITPSTCTGFATLAFADALDHATLEFVDSTIGWILVGQSGVTVA